MRRIEAKRKPVWRKGLPSQGGNPLHLKKEKTAKCKTGKFKTAKLR